MSTNRQCSNWLDSFMEWTVHRSEAKEQLILWTGLFILASSLRRKVVMSKALLGSWNIYPYLYIIFVAPPGKARKTTTTGYAEDLIRDIPGIKIADTAMTQQDLLEDLKKSDDGSISILSGEFANFIAPSGELMYEFLTGVFDGKSKYSYGTLSRGKRLATKPCINLLGATVPSFIAEMPSAVIEGGFASRVIFIYETAVRQRQFFYDRIIKPEKLSKLEIALKADLAYIAKNVEGEFKPADEETRDHIEKWYKGTADNFPLTDPRTHGYFERKPAHVVKVAMLIHLAYDNELIITKEDFDKALSILEATEDKLTKVFHAVGKNPYITAMDQIKEYVHQRRKVSRKELLSRFYHTAPPQQLGELIGALIAMDEIKMNGDDPTKIVYTAID